MPKNSRTALANNKTADVKRSKRQPRPGSQQITITLPTWVLAVACSEKPIRGESRNEVLGRWIFEYASGRYPHAVPAPAQ